MCVHLRQMVLARGIAGRVRSPHLSRPAGLARETSTCIHRLPTVASSGVSWRTEVGSQNFRTLNLSSSTGVGPDRLVNEIGKEGADGLVGQFVGVGIALIALIIVPQHVGGRVGQPVEEIEGEDVGVAA